MEKRRKSKKMTKNENLYLGGIISQLLSDVELHLGEEVPVDGHGPGATVFRPLLATFES
jgi:hypothetical protein